jgi:hypothetical protein
MAKGFFFDGIDILCNHQSVNQTVENAVPVFSDAAYPTVGRKNAATMMAEMTLDLAVCQFFI